MNTSTFTTQNAQLHKPHQPRKTSQFYSSPYSSHQALSISTVDTGHPGTRESRALSNFENPAFDPRHTISLYLSPEQVTSRSRIPESRMSCSISLIRENPQYNSLAMSPNSSFVFPQHTYTQPETSQMGRNLVSSQIQEEMQRMKEIRELQDLQSMEDMVKSGRTMTSIIKNDRIWKDELARSNAVLEDCRRYSESANKRDFNVPTRDEWKMSTPRQRGYSLFNIETANSTGWSPEVKRSFARDSSVTRPSESKFSNARSLVMSPWNRGSENKSLGRQIWEEVEQQREIRRIEDLRSMEEMVLKGQTITDMIKREKTREKELRESQMNIRQLRGNVY